MLMFTYGTMSINIFKKRTPKVEPQLQKYFDKLDSIYSANDIDIDYSKISTIQVMDSLPTTPKISGPNYEGLYNRLDYSMYINMNQGPAFMLGKYEDVILVIMAHEVAHSQGYGHSNDPCSIMFYSSDYLLYLLLDTEVEYLVTDIYFSGTPSL